MNAEGGCAALGPSGLSERAARDAARTLVVAGLGKALPIVTELGERFAGADKSLALVGGSVRDALLGRLGHDLDFTTDARPPETIALLGDWAEAMWDVGIKYGTIGARFGDFQLEITTYRAEAYNPDSRKPYVVFGNTLAEDLVRRDFAINAMALELPEPNFIDLHGGLHDLTNRILRCPASADSSFADDPLRMMRAARFVSQLGFDVAADVVVAMKELADRLQIVSAERIRDELCKLLLGEHPRAGLQLLVATGLAEHVVPEVPALALEIDEHHRHKDVYEHSLTVLEQVIDLESTHEPKTGPDLVLRLAALLHDIGKPKTRRFESDGGVSFHHHEVVGAKLTTKRLRALRMPNDIIREVSELVELHLRFHGYSGGQWTDSAVRRYVRDAGDQLPRLHKLTRADCTTRNRRKAAALAASYDSLESRIAELSAQEELNSIRPDLDGNAIMAILDVSPGRDVGAAYKFLLERRLDRGPVSPDVAAAELRAWWAAIQAEAPNSNTAMTTRSTVD